MEGSEILSSVKTVHKNLENAIERIVSNKEKYVKNPRTDFTRNRKLNMKTVIRQILSMEGGSLNKELHFFASSNGIESTPSAFVQQRSKISSEAFKDIFNLFNTCCTDLKKYKGYRLFAVDGSDIDRSRDPNSESFTTTSNNPDGFNKIHLNALYDLCNKIYLDVLIQPTPKEDEHKALREMLSRNVFVGKNIIMADRGYESYNTIAHLLTTQNVDFLCRVKHGKGAMFEISKLPVEELDKDINIDITTTQTNEDKLAGRRFIQTGSKKGKKNSPKTHIGKWDFSSPYMLKFRVVRFLLETGEYETIITSLSREEFSITDIQELYHLRWGIETSFRELKYAIGLINLHCKKEDLILQEIYASLIMYNYCSRIAGNAEIYKRNNTVYAYKVNFTMAIHLCRKFFRESGINFKKLIKDIGKYSEPIRPGRKDKRNIRAKGFVGFTYRVAA